MKSVSALILAVSCAHVVVGTPGTWQVGQTVQTSSGPVQGHSAVNAPDVSEYLGIPYANPPIGELRWAAPQALNGSSTINGTHFGHSCPANAGQTLSGATSSLSALNLTSVSLQVISSLLGQTQDIFSEDCLTLNVWSKPQTGESRKAVLVWIHGGGFNTGTSNIAGYNGQHLANDEDVIVVSLNYRLNIFGFPGAPNAKNNLGLLDQRMAVEWVRDNIEGFGGDPTRITLFGESAGAGSVDFYSFAWTSDPIVAGFIAQSGTANAAVAPSVSASSWYNAATKLSCGNATSDPAEVLTCMRAKDQASLLEAIDSGPGLGAVTGNFGPTVDGDIVFADNIALAAAGSFIKKPYLLGHNDNEVGLFRIIALLGGQVSPDAYWDLQNLYAFDCGTAQRATFSAAQAPTWRYRYFGNFPNLALTTVPESGAWHGSEVPTVFGTDLEVQNLLPRTSAQSEITPYVMGAWAAFAKDPENGLTNYGWPKYQPDGETLVRLAYNNQTGPNLGHPADYDYLCPIVFALGQSLIYGTTTAPAINVLAGLGRSDIERLFSMFAT